MFLFFGIPSEIRSMIIDKMSARDRLKFSWCSKLSNKEAKASKNYLYSLSFYYSTEMSITVLILYSDLRTHEEQEKFTNSSWYPGTTLAVWKGLMTETVLDIFDSKSRKMFEDLKYCGYFLRFQSINKYQFVSCTNQDGRSFWNMTLDDSKSLVQNTIDYFQDILHDHQHTVKNIAIRSRIPFNVDLDVDHWGSLEELHFNASINHEQFISKVRNPLKVLKIGSVDPNSEVIARLPQIYEVQDQISFYSTELNYEQMSRLSASNIAINGKYITEYDVFNFIESWQNGIRHLNSCEWWYSGEPFDYNKLLNLLRIEHPKRIVRINHKVDVRKFASLACMDSCLRFQEEDDVKVFENINEDDENLALEDNLNLDNALFQMMLILHSS